MISVIAVAIGGGLGSVLRYTLIQLVMRLHTQPFPLGTMLVNILGSLAIGMLMAKYAGGALNENARLLLVTGVLGGFTTFSAFSWDVLDLWQRGHVLQAAAYIAGSVVLSLAACALGYYAVRL